MGTYYHFGEVLAHNLPALRGETRITLERQDASLKDTKFAPFRPPERPASAALSGAWRAKALLGSVGRAVVAAAAGDDDDDDGSDGESEEEEEEKEKSPIEAEVEKSLDTFMGNLATGAKTFMDKVDMLLGRVKEGMGTTFAADGNLAKLLLEKLEEGNVTLAAFTGILSTKVIRPLLAVLGQELEKELPKLLKPTDEVSAGADANADPVADPDANAEVPNEAAPGATGSNANDELLRQLLETYKEQILSATGESALMKRLSPIIKDCVQAASKCGQASVDEEQPLVQPNDSAKCLVQQLWPALVASLEAQARHSPAHYPHLYSHAELVPCTRHMHALLCIGERRHPLQRFGADQESGKVGAADGGAPR